MKISSILIMIVLSSALNTYPQQIKTFKGILYNGNTTYQYYEDEDYIRIYHGTFKWLSGNNSLQVMGQYLNDKKSGLWIDKTLNQYGVAATTITYNFKEGMLNGLLKYQNTSTRETIEANFKDGHLIDVFTHTSPSASIKAQFDEYGFADGIWEINISLNDVKYKDSRTYSKGFLRKRLYRNLNSGEVIVNIKGSNLYTGFEELNLQQIVTKLSDSGYEISSIPISSDYNEYVEYNSVNGFFRSENYDGGYHYPQINEKLYYALCDFFKRGPINKFKSIPQQYKNCYLNYPVLK